MQSLIEIMTPIFLYMHIGAGLVALILFWVPIFSQKGGINHRRSGRCYVNAMWAVVITAILLSIKNIYTAHYLSAAFLGFLAFITMRPLWSGISILENKHEISCRHKVTDQVLLISIVIFGGTLIVVARLMPEHSLSNVVLVFGVLGVANIFELSKSFKSVTETNWLGSHISALCVTGIASHTAFLVFGASSIIGQVFTSYWAMLPWFLPTVVGVVGIAVAKRRFLRRQQVKL